MPWSSSALISRGLTTTSAASNTTKAMKAASSRLCGLANPKIRTTVRRVSFWSTTDRSVRSDRIAAPMGCIALIADPFLSCHRAPSGQLAEPPELGLPLAQPLPVEVVLRCSLQQGLGLPDRGRGVRQERLGQVCSCGVEVCCRYD